MARGSTYRVSPCCFETLKKYQGVPVENGIPNKVPNKIPNKDSFANRHFSDVTLEVLSYITEHPYATAVEIGKFMGISDRMVRKHIALLRDAGVISREGSNKTGRWRVKGV